MLCEPFQNLAAQNWLCFLPCMWKYFFSLMEDIFNKDVCFSCYFYIHSLPTFAFFPVFFEGFLCHNADLYWVQKSRLEQLIISHGQLIILFMSKSFNCTSQKLMVPMNFDLVSYHWGYTRIVPVLLWPPYFNWCCAELVQNSSSHRPNPRQLRHYFQFL